MPKLLPVSYRITVSIYECGGTLFCLIPGETSIWTIRSLTLVWPSWVFSELHASFFHPILSLKSLLILSVNNALLSILLSVSGHCIEFTCDNCRIILRREWLLVKLNTQLTSHSQLDTIHYESGIGLLYTLYSVVHDTIIYYRQGRLLVLVCSPNRLCSQLPFLSCMGIFGGAKKTCYP